MSEPPVGETFDEAAMAVRCEDSLRALSLAENMGWVKIGGMPEGAPPSSVADLRRGWSSVSESWGERALLVAVNDDDEVVFFIIPYVESAPLVELVN
jgi:hypothetical protein